MCAMNSAVDTYATKARVLPVVCAIAPAFVFGTLFVPHVMVSPSLGVGGLLICAALMLTAQLGRDRGKAIEPSLFRQWGGKPSVAMLRHRDKRIDSRTKERWRLLLSSAVPNLELPTVDDEAACPRRADEGYEGATTWLLAQTRDKTRFRLLAAEGVTYGFRRNLFGMKRYALCVDAVSLIGLATLWSVGMGVEPWGLWTAMAGTTLHAGLFLFVVRSKWVRIAAEAYGRQLLACSDELVGAKGTAATTSAT